MILKKDQKNYFIDTIKLLIKITLDTYLKLVIFQKGKPNENRNFYIHFHASYNYYTKVL
jgi:hypothetical protein